MGVTYTIGTLAALTGLSPHTIRAWERRYGALVPSRSDTNRRIYSDSDVERLSVLRRIVEAGHSIGQVAQLPIDQLHILDRSHLSQRAMNAGSRSRDPKAYLEACLGAMNRLDSEALESHLARGGAALGVARLLSEVVVPLLVEIERGWIDGTVSISREHLASTALRAYLERVRVSMVASPGAPRLLVTTPRNQHHEIGALMAAIVAAMDGWHVIYLGPNLPANEIAEAAGATSADAIALSLVFPTEDEEMARDLRKLRNDLGTQTAIVVGGRAAHNFLTTLSAIGATVCSDLGAFRDALGDILASGAVGF